MMLLDGGAANRQAQAGVSTAGREPGLENSNGVVRRNSYSGIFKFDSHAFEIFKIGPTQPDGERAAYRHRPERIQGQVEKHLLQAVGNGRNFELTQRILQVELQA
ncbi:MAG: hypothetical protein ABSD87_13465, partial [Candidatus Acidiferrales bacterium]